MVDPTTLAIMAVKKIAVDAVTNPEKIIKYIFIFIICPFLVLIVIFGIPLLVILNIPSLILQNAFNLDKEVPLTENQIDTIALYEQSPMIIDDYLEEQIELKIQYLNKYLHPDDIVINNSFEITWRETMAIHTVLYEQNFDNVKLEHIVNLGKNFVDIEIETETYYEFVKETDEKKKMLRAIINVRNKDFKEVLREELNFNVEQQEIALNIYANLQLTDINGNLDLAKDIDLNSLKEYPAGSSDIIYYSQKDKRWANLLYGNDSIYETGCGPTALAMVVASLTSNSVTPYDVAKWSYENGYKVSGGGSYWSLMTAAGKYYGLDVESVSRTNPEKIVKALSEGHPVIVSMGRGHFTTSGHFIVLRGFTEDGKVLINDPWSIENTNKEWDLSIIMNESSTNGGINGSPFWIFK